MVYDVAKCHSQLCAMIIWLVKNVAACVFNAIYSFDNIFTLFLLRSCKKYSSTTSALCCIFSQCFFFALFNSGFDHQLRPFLIFLYISFFLFCLIFFWRLMLYIYVFHKWNYIYDKIQQIYIIPFKNWTKKRF